MKLLPAQATDNDDGVATSLARACSSLAFLVLLGAGDAAIAQDIRYSWIDMSFMAQDVGRAGSLTPLPGQTVDIAVSDGAGVRRRSTSL
jgi:hypothetical protein